VILRHDASGAALGPGDYATTFRGEAVRVLGVQRPHKPESTGRVEVEFLGDDGRPTGAKGSYYPGVIGASWRAA
jgi:hypothetical protein